MRPIPNREDDEVERETEPISIGPEDAEDEYEEPEDDESWLEVHEF